MYLFRGHQTGGGIGFVQHIDEIGAGRRWFAAAWIAAATWAAL
jgi:hypothetical protein